MHSHLAYVQFGLGTKKPNLCKYTKGRTNYCEKKIMTSIHEKCITFKVTRVFIKYPTFNKFMHLCVTNVLVEMKKETLCLDI